MRTPVQRTRHPSHWHTLPGLDPLRIQQLVQGGCLQGSHSFCFRELRRLQLCKLAQLLQLLADLRHELEGLVSLRRCDADLNLDRLQVPEGRLDLLSPEQLVLHHRLEIGVLRAGEEGDSLVQVEELLPGSCPLRILHGARRSGRSRNAHWCR